jgi:Helix-turn-helix of DDE superfamily endonuclease
MKYQELKNLKPLEFKRFCGVHQETFQKMAKIVEAEKVLQKKSGRPSKLSTEDQILMTLEYWREYRTYFHLGKSWGVAESNAYRTVRRIEDILIKSGCFNLPGKKKLVSNPEGINTIVIDVSEHEVERPKKNRNTVTVANKNAILSSHK